MILVYCRRKSDGARHLVEWINQNGGKALRVGRGPIKQDLIHGNHLWVNWGDGSVPNSAPGKWLNRKLFHNKFNELQKLAATGIAVPQHQRNKPSVGVWLARLNNHHEANDLVKNLSTGDYYVEYIETIADWRCHIFKGQSVRLGHKVPRIENPHPKFRSWNTGWKLIYDGTNPPRGLRDTAKKACEALGYDFGGVDLGVRKDGRVVVWEVNAAPGLEGNTIATYGKHLMGFNNGNA